MLSDAAILFGTAICDKKRDSIREQRAEVNGEENVRRQSRALKATDEKSRRCSAIAFRFGVIAKTRCPFTGCQNQFCEQQVAALHRQNITC